MPTITAYGGYMIVIRYVKKLMNVKILYLVNTFDNVFID